MICSMVPARPTRTRLRRPRRTSRSKHASTQDITPIYTRRSSSASYSSLMSGSSSVPRMSMRGVSLQLVRSG